MYCFPIASVEESLVVRGLNNWVMLMLFWGFRFEHDNINHPAIVVGRKPGASNRTL